MTALAVFYGGPLDGASEPLSYCPRHLVFSAARILGESTDGTITFDDLVYEREVVNAGPVVIVRYEYQP